MQSIIKVIRQDRALFVGGILTLVIVIGGAVVNFYTSSSDPGEGMSLLLLVLFACFYIPPVLFNRVGQWQIGEFGFVVNRAVWISVAVSVLIGIWWVVTHPEFELFEQLNISLLESFARVGEELLFRGFIYLWLLKVFRDKRRPYLWAILGSSLAFALVHTQSYLLGSGTSILVVFLFGLLVSIMRHKTGSLLPAITLHCAMNTNLLGVVFGWALYSLITAWPVVIGCCKAQHSNRA